MAVSAPSAKDLPSADSSGMVDMRTGGSVLAGSYVYEGDELVTTWHSHDLHQLEYAIHGVMEVETAAAHHLLPPQQAVWIPAGVEHRSAIRTAVRTISAFFAPGMVPSPGDRVRIVAVPAVLRAMMVYSERWPIGRPTSEPLADGYFLVLAGLISEALEHEAPLSLPTSDDPVVGPALAWTREHLATATVKEVAKVVGVSERSLRRRFEAVVGMSWRQYLLQARLLRAMALLAEPGPSVLHVATSVGFDSISAFNRAFRLRAGEPPSMYRRRIVPGSRT